MVARFDYRVRPHDSLRKIASTQLGDAARWPEVARLNHLKAPYRLLVGMPLRLPTRTGSRAPMSPLLAHPTSRPLRGQTGPVPSGPSIPPKGSSPAYPSTPGPLSISSAGSSDLAANSHYPTLKYEFATKCNALIPQGELELEIKAELEMQRDSVFSWNLTDSEFEALARSYGTTASISGKQLGRDPISLKIKSEYDAQLVKVFTSAKVLINPITRKPEIEMQIGWKFTNCSYAFKPPNAHEFTFEPQEVSARGIKGKVILKATLKTKLSGPNPPTLLPVVVPLTLPQLLPVFSARDIHLPLPQTVTFTAALMIIAMVMLAPVGI